MRPEEIFQDIVDFMIFGNTISSISEASGISTISTNDLKTLEDGMLIEITDTVTLLPSAYQVSNITTNAYQDYSFDITATGLTATSWQLALYYEFGRALEIGNTLKDKKDDPTNKNKRFPLMWLLTDIEKTTIETGYNADITIAFIYLSDKNWKVGKRIDTSFEPILDPLVTLFKNTINNSVGARYFSLPYGEVREFNETDKFKYGSIEGNTNVFNDITDAIQLNVNLNFFTMNECVDQYELPVGVGSMFIVS